VSGRSITKRKTTMSQLKIIPLGGMGNVTQNMFVYEYDNEMLIVDCGIGFPDIQSPGVDVLIPDITYLKNALTEGKQIVGMILTHGHDDHIAATPYLLPELPEFPIFGSPLTAAFAENRMKDSNLQRTITVIKNPQVFKISEHFSAQAINMTHSVPDTRHYAIHTPEGIIYHGSDFKLDHDPIGGQKPDYDTITQLGEQGVLCMMVDCLRVERPDWSKSESTVGPTLEKIMAQTRGKYIVTLMSSHIHRIQQVVNAAQQHGRKVVFVGRSVEQNVEAAMGLGELEVPRDMLVNKREIGDYDDSKLCVVIAGSQGQEGSSLMRAVYGDHPVIQIKPQDNVIFSADVIPGNEIPFYGAIDELCRNGIHVMYPDIEPNLHQSGHASAAEQEDLVKKVKPKYLMPIGGADRHRVKFVEFVAQPAGYSEHQVLIPGSGDVLAFEGGKPQVVDHISLRPVAVDGLGVGDVGPIVLSDRRTLGQSGIIVLAIPKFKGHYDVKNMTIVSRGFVFMKEADEVIEFIKKATGEIVADMGDKPKEEELKRAIEKRLARRLYKVIQREPMIVPVILES